MITKEEALKIVKTVVHDIEERLYFYITEDKPASKIYGGALPDNCWYVVYSPFRKDRDELALISSMGICIDKDTGKVLYNGSLNDEG